MGLFWNYFKNTLRFALIWKPGPLGILTEGASGALDQAREDERWLRDQFLPTKAEVEHLEHFAGSRGLMRFPEEEDSAWYTRTKNAYLFWKSGGKVSGLIQYLENFGFNEITVTEYSDPDWAEFAVAVSVDAGSASVLLLLVLINEMKPARSLLTQLEVNFQAQAPLSAYAVVAVYIEL